MNKIVTAIGNKNINLKLKQEEKIEVIGEDIQYEDGILELLEKEININFLIISEEIVNKNKIINLIEKIKIINKYIKIILILENKDEELENILFSKGIYKIIYNNQMTITDLIKILNKKDDEDELKKEIINLRKLIMENSQKNNLNKIKNKINLNNLKNKFTEKIYKINNTEKNKIINNEIISISGPSGVGKSIISVNLAKALSYKQDKILLMDFDILNNSLYTILGVKNYPQNIEKTTDIGMIKDVDKININEFNVENFIIKVNKKIDLISITDLLFYKERKVDIIKIEKIINKLKQKYNTIIIDTSSECFFDLTKEIINNSNKNIFVAETNLLEIKKAKQLLNIYINKWKIKKEKINILFNKYDKECVNIKLLKFIFNEFNILGVLKYNSKYNKLINKNNKFNFYDKKIRNEYIKINNKI